MRRRSLNISAALAIAIERQVEDIIAKAKATCALQVDSAARRGLPDPTISDDDGYALARASEDAEAERRRELDEALSPGWQAAGLEEPRAEPRPAPRLDIWRRLRFLFKPRPFRV